MFDVLMNNELAILIKSLFAEKEDLSVTTEGKDILIFISKARLVVQTKVKSVVHGPFFTFIINYAQNDYLG